MKDSEEKIAKLEENTQKTEQNSEKYEESDKNTISNDYSDSKFKNFFVSLRDILSLPKVFAVLAVATILLGLSIWFFDVQAAVYFEENATSSIFSMLKIVCIGLFVISCILLIASLVLIIISKTKNKKN